MEETTLKIYKSYFKNHQDFKLKIYEQSHVCFFCKNEQKIRFIYITVKKTWLNLY